MVEINDIHTGVRSILGRERRKEGRIILKLWEEPYKISSKGFIESSVGLIYSHHHMISLRSSSAFIVFTFSQKSVLLFPLIVDKAYGGGGVCACACFVILVISVESKEKSIHKTKRLAIIFYNIGCIQCSQKGLQTFWENKIRNL